MLRWLAATDRLTAASRPAWGWLGELSLVILGVHLAADRLDDVLLGWLAPLQLPWPTPDTPLLMATWAAIAVELLVDIWAAWTLFRSRSEAVTGPNEWLGRASIGNAVAAVAWGPLALVGAWVVAMAVEDLAAPHLGEPALWLSWLVAASIAWRLGWPGWLRVALQGPQPQKRIDGLLAAPLVLVVLALAVRHGLPIHHLSALIATVGG